MMAATEAPTAAPPAVAPARGAVRLDKIGKVYGGRHVLRDVTTQLLPREVTAILGPNGAGKSTLLGILATLIRPSRGTLTRLRRGDIGWVGHDPGLYGDLSARENLAVFASLHGVSAQADRIDLLLTRVGLRNAAPADAPVRTFSRGMMQRLALARALLHEPRVLLFDEPSSALDPAGAAWLVSVLRAERDAGRVVVLVTHDLGAVAAAADHIVILRRGRVLLDQRREGGMPPAEIRRLYEERVLGNR